MLLEQMLLEKIVARTNFARINIVRTNAVRTNDVRRKVGVTNIARTNFFEHTTLRGTYDIITCTFTILTLMAWELVPSTYHLPLTTYQKTVGDNGWHNHGNGTILDPPKANDKKLITIVTYKCS
jgi:hypothetical protein